MRHLMSPLDFTVEELDKLMDLANDIEANPEKYAHACAGKKLATLFYEPSTRTRLRILAEAFSASLLRIPVLLPREKVYPIRFEPYPAMQISVQCVIQKKVPQW